MNTLKETKALAGLKSWETQKLRLKLKFPKLKDADMDFDERDKDEMLMRLQDVVGRSKEELQAIIGIL